MKKAFFNLLLFCVIYFLAGCTSTSTGSSGYNPAQGMQVATLSGTPGGIDTVPTISTAVTPPDLGPFILMQEDFSDPDSGWEIYDGDYGRAGYEQGGYVVSALQKTEYNWGIAGVNYDNVRIELDATVLVAPGDLSDGFGVDCRIQQNGDGYGFRISSDGYAAIVLFLEGEQQVLYDWTANPAVKMNGETNHLTAICEGDHFSLLVNDEYVAEVIDDTFISGDLALSAISYSDDPVEVLFDDLIVQSIGNPYEYADRTPYPVTVINNSTYDVCALYISSADEDYWGDSWVNEAKPLAASNTISIDDNINMIIDIQALTCDGLRLLEVYGIDVSAENTVVIEEPVLRQGYDFTSFEGWTESPAKGSASITQGDYYALDAPAGVGFTSGVVNFVAQDIRLRTDAYLSGAADESQAVYGLMCRIQNDGSGIFLAIRGDGYGSVQKWDGSLLTPLTEWVYSDAINPGISANYIEAVCENDYYSLFVNGIYVTEIQNPDFQIGKIGVGLVPPSASAAKVEFDFVEAWEPLK